MCIGHDNHIEKTDIVTALLCRVNNKCFVFQHYLRIEGNDKERGSNEQWKQPQKLKKEKREHLNETYYFILKEISRI